MTTREFVEIVQAGDLAAASAALAAQPELAVCAIAYADERRPLHLAVMNRQPEMVRLLVRAGSPVRRGVHPFRQATSPLAMAQDREYAEIVEILERAEEPASIPGEPPREDPPLTAAVKAGDIGVVLQLLDAGLDANEPLTFGGPGWSQSSAGGPLWHAAASGRRDMVELLLARGADPNAHVDSSGSSVYSAYSHRQWDIAALLERHGGLVTADIAGLYRQTATAAALLAAGGEDVARDLLVFGACGGAVEVVELALREIGWDATAPGWHQALTEPLSYWHHIPWLYAGVKEFTHDGYLACFRAILARCGPNHRGSFGRTALHEVAAMREWVPDAEAAAFAAELLQAGARVDIRDELLESTPLGWACRWGRASVAGALMRHGAPAVEPDSPRWAQPLAWARRHGHAAIQELLLAQR